MTTLLFPDVPGVHIERRLSSRRNNVWYGYDNEGVPVVVKVQAPGYTLNDLVGEANAINEIRARYARRRDDTINAPRVLHLHLDVPIPALVLSYIPGQILALWQPQKLDEVIDVAVRITDLFAAYHLAGYSHNDGRPANIVLSALGPAGIDFELARPKDQVPLLGSRQFASPQRLRHQPDARSDHYSFGVMLSQLVAQDMTHSPHLFTAALSDETLATIREVEKPVFAVADRFADDVRVPMLHRIVENSIDPILGHRPTLNELRYQLTALQP